MFGVVKIHNKEEINIPFPKFNVGDTVRVKKECGKYIGWEGKILAYDWSLMCGYHNPDRGWSYEVELRKNTYATINEIFLDGV